MSAPHIFYPACRAILQVVFEDFGQEGGDADPETPLVIPVLPKSCVIHKNSYKTADSWELTFDAGDLPFDPRIIRAGAAEIYLFQQPRLNSMGAVISRRSPLSDIDPSHQIPRDIVDTLSIEVRARQARDRFTVVNKPRVAGLFDRASLDLSGDGKWVTITGQDYTAHLAALQWKPNPNGTARRVPVGKRIDLLLEDILEEADSTGKLRIDVRGFHREGLPIVGAGDVRGARGIVVEAGTSYWDIMYGLALRHGMIAYVDGVDVVLSSAKTLTADEKTYIKRLAWGRNIESLHLERELGSETPPTIIARVYDQRTKKTISVQYPAGQVDNARQPIKRATKVHGAKARVTSTERQRAKAPTSKGKKVTTLRRRDEFEIVTVHRFTSRDDLAKVAENAYYQKGPRERRVIATTRDLIDAPNGHPPSDMLSLTSGDPVTIVWDEFNAEILASPEKSEPEKVAHLVARGFNREVARVIASRYAVLQGLDRPLRVKEATYNYDADDGISIELELYDFIMVDGRRPDDGSPVPLQPTKRYDGDFVGWTAEEREAMARRYP